MTIGFISFVGIVIYFVKQQQKWFKEHSPLNWQYFGNVKTIDIKKIKKLNDIIILQDTKKSFISLVVVPDENGIWKYIYEFKIKEFDQYHLLGYKITFYDNHKRNKNKIIAHGTYSD